MKSSASDSAKMQAAIEKLHRETVSKKRRIQFCVVLWVVAFLLLLTGMAGMLNAGFVSLLCIFGSLVLTVFSAFLLILPQHTQTLQYLRETMDKQAVGVFIEQIEITAGAERRQLLGIISEALRTLEEGDAACLSQEHRKRLNDALKVPDFEQETEFLLAILHAYNHIGDETAQACMAKLAAADGETAGERRVRTLARQYLPAIAERLERQQTGKDLLRASAVTGGASELLRPACSQSTAPPELLLRAGTGPSEAKTDFDPLETIYREKAP